METLLLIALLIIVGYVIACAIWPFTAHRWCKGTGKRRSPSGRAWRTCRGCDGTGRRVRLGRRLYEMLSGTDDSG